MIYEQYIPNTAASSSQKSQLVLRRVEYGLHIHTDVCRPANCRYIVGKGIATQALLLQAPYKGVHDCLSLVVRQYTIPN